MILKTIKSDIYSKLDLDFTMYLDVVIVFHMINFATCWPSFAGQQLGHAGLCALL